MIFSNFGTDKIIKLLEFKIEIWLPARSLYILSIHFSRYIVNLTHFWTFFDILKILGQICGPVTVKMDFSVVQKNAIVISFPYISNPLVDTFWL